MQTFIATTVIFGIAIFAMSVGVIFSNRTIKGSCGGLERDEDGIPTCDFCELKAKCEGRNA